MPCYTIQTATIELGKANADLLAIALGAIGISDYTYQNGVLTIKGRTATAELIADIKRQYSKQIVLTQAKKRGWQVKEVKPFQYQIIKR